MGMYGAGLWLWEGKPEIRPAKRDWPQLSGYLR